MRVDSAKRRLRKQWDREWGDPDTEGNLWWLGSVRENWVAVMGYSKWEWFCASWQICVAPLLLTSVPGGCSANRAHAH